MFGKTRTSIRNHFITGFLIVIPLAVTISSINWVDKTIMTLFSVLPNEYHPEKVISSRFPGLGILLSLIVIYFVGLFGSIYIGRKLVRVYEAVFERIPGVRWLYVVAKEIMEAIVKALEEVRAGGKDKFSAVVLIEYPRAGIHTIAFVTGETGGEIREKIGDSVNVFVPTTPNPTSGFFLMVPKKDVTALDMSVDKAFKLIISVGMIEAADKAVKKKGPQDG